MIILGLVILGGSGCVLLQPDKPVKNTPGNLRVSGDVTVSAVDRKGF